MDHGAEHYSRFLAGDDGGIVEIIKNHKDGLILFLNRYVNNIYTAEELAEDTFFKLVTRKPRFRGNSSFKTWLYAIGRNVAVDHMRRVGQNAGYSDEELAQFHRDEDELERAYLREERKILVHRALARIGPERGKALYLRYIEELDIEQIALVLGKSKRQVSNLLYQAKRSLKLELEQEGICDEGL